MQTAYGLDKAYKKGLDGTGQTIVIVDAFGSNTITDDANEFSALNGLPALTSSNFQIFTPNGPVNCGTACVNGNWQFETTLDVEWAHAMAPGANIALVLTADLHQSRYRKPFRHPEPARQRNLKQFRDL